MSFRTRSTRLIWPLLAMTLLTSASRARAQAPVDMGVKLVDVAAAAGITTKTIFGDEKKNRFLFETTGCGAALFDYDNDGFLDVFLVNGTRVDPLPADQTPTNRLYRNK